MPRKPLKLLGPSKKMIALGKRTGQGVPDDYKGCRACVYLWCIKCERGHCPKHCRSKKVLPIVKGYRRGDFEHAT